MDDTKKIKQAVEARLETAIQLVDEHFVPPELVGARNVETTKKLLSDKTLVTVGMYANHPIYSVHEGPGNGTFFVVEDELIQYYVKYQPHIFVPLHSLCQVAVWRDEDFAPTMRYDGPTMAAYVFRTVLLPKFGEVISDKIQTDFGRYFWVREISWAITHSKYAYFLKLSGEDTGHVEEIIRIKDEEHWSIIKKKSWGPTLKDQLIRLLISEKPILFPDRTEYERRLKVL